MNGHIHESVLGQGNCELCEARERRLSEALPLIDEAVCDFENGDDLWEDWKQRARAVLASRPSDVSAPAAAEPSAQTEDYQGSVPAHEKIPLPQPKLVPDSLERPKTPGGSQGA